MALDLKQKARLRKQRLELPQDEPEAEPEDPIAAAIEAKRRREGATRCLLLLVQLFRCTAQPASCFGLQLIVC